MKTIENKTYRINQKAGKVLELQAALVAKPAHAGDDQLPNLLQQVIDSMKYAMREKNRAKAKGDSLQEAYYDGMETGLSMIMREIKYMLGK